MHFLNLKWFTKQKRTYSNTHKYPDKIFEEPEKISEEPTEPTIPAIKAITLDENGILSVSPGLTAQQLATMIVYLNSQVFLKDIGTQIAIANQNNQQFILEFIQAMTELKQKQAENELKDSVAVHPLKGWNGLSEKL